MATTVGLCLEPLDVLFFRDGRPSTGSGRSVSGLPLPQTVAGAMRAALLRLAGCDFRALRDTMSRGASFHDAVGQSCGSEHIWISSLAVRGPWLARCGPEDCNIEALVPVPATLHREKEKGHPDKLYGLSPLPKGSLPGWDAPKDHEGLRPLWLKRLAATKPATGYLTRLGLEQFLKGKTVAAEEVVQPDDLFGLDYRVGISIAPDRLVAEESKIFGQGFLALKKGVVLYVEIVLPDGAPDRTVFDKIETIPIGGEGRHALIRCVNPFSWPEVKLNEKLKPLIMLTTPCAFEAGWKPRVLDDQIASAAVSGSLALSGWDLARGGPKPTRFAVRAGSIYFLDSMPDAQGDTLAENEEDRLQGWGCCLKGVWKDE